MTAQTPDPKRWGQDIEPGAQVTTYGRHGVGQPAVDGTVESVERGQVVIFTIGGHHRRRSIRNVRRVD